MTFRTWGGKREGAGRPPKGKRAGVSHARRARHEASKPQHVTLRVLPDVMRLRTRAMYRCIRRALLGTLARSDFRMCHTSIQGNHVHFVVEADDNRALARGMQGFMISCAKKINAALERSGHVFADRYHARALSTPREVRNALCYVMNNWRRHGEDRRSPFRFDPFSTAVLFDGWKERPGPISDTIALELLPAPAPHTWLLEKGWKRHGLLSPHERPGPEAD
jgi:hypothetical protein